MRIDNLLRRVLPPKIRKAMGCWSLNIACHSMLLLRLYVYILHGYRIYNMCLVNGHTEYLYHGRIIKSPFDGTGSFFEVFYDKVYDSVLTPRKGDIVIDVGAYVGMWSVRAAIAVGNEGKVIAIEPSGYNRGFLGINVAGLPVEVLPIMVSDYDGVGILYLAKASACSSMITGNGQPVETICHKLDTLVDNLGLPKVDFIKIDAEGAELEVLMGAERILKGDVKLSIASYHISSRGEPEQPRLVSFLQDRGFTVKTTRGLRGYTYATKNNEAS